MQRISTSIAQAPPIPPDALRRSRILARVPLSPSLADVVAGMAFGADRRDDDGMLWAVTASRCSSNVGSRANG